MADDQTQQTRVLLVDGQTIILQGNTEENSISELNADLLHQALHGASAATDVEAANEEEYPAALPEPDASNENLVAIFQGAQGETHTIQLTVEQAEALGLRFSVDGEDKPIEQDIPENVPEPDMHLADTRTQLVYPEDPLSQDETKVKFENCVTDTSDPSDLQNEQDLEGDSGSVLQPPVEGMGVLPSNISAFIDAGSNHPITLIPQFVDGQMTYAVKLGDDHGDGNVLQDHQFSGLQEDAKSGIAMSQTVPAAVEPMTVPATSAVASAVTLNSSTTTSSIINSINSVISSAPSSQPTSANDFQCSRTGGATVAADKHKASYVLVPGNNTNASSVISKFTSSQNTRLTETFHNVSRNQLISGNTVLSNPQMKNAHQVALSAPSTGTTTQIGTVNALGGVPIVSPGLNISRTTATASLLTSSVSTTLTGGGMIRVVAGASASRTGQQHQHTHSNGNKLASILNPSSRLVTTTNSSSGQKILSFNSSTSKTPTSGSTEVVSNAVSAALTRMPVPNFNSTKPLGSSENPIQLVQHGQTFHSVQALSQEQLRQIATVLQQQHLESAPRTKNVLYDAETNTRIIYRVVYPEDLDLREPKSPLEDKAVASLGNGRGRGRRGRPPKSAGRGRGTVEAPAPRKPGFHNAVSSVDVDLDEDRLMDDTAKGERKKQVARTRSGRLSRPPRHMVKDYKRLHHLDFADADLDDSDGGYSDYQMSDHEVEEVPDKVTPKELLPGLVIPKRKISSHFRCPTCQKIYLGHSRMARHFEMFPDHGSIEQLQVPSQNNNSSSNNSNHTDSSLNAADGTAVTPPSPVDQPSTPNSTDDKFVSRRTGPNGMVRTGPSRRRGKRRGPWSYMTPESRSERRKIKLREVLGTCEAAELSEVAGPAVAGVLSLWDLLLLRVEAVRTEESYMATLCDELRALLEKVRAVMSEILQPLDSKCDTAEDYLELQDEVLCSTLGVACGRYRVDDHKLRCQRQSNWDYKEPLCKRIKSDAALLETTPQLEDPLRLENKLSCPEVLSALALDAKPSAASSPAVGARQEVEESADAPSRTLKEEESKVSDGNKSMEDVEEDHQFLLTGASDMCVDELAQGTGGDEQQTQDLQTVDDIVNERLKNLTGGNSLVDFGSCMTGAVPVPEMAKTLPRDAAEPSDVLMENLERFQQGPVANDAVGSFDPEMALAAMGEGDQGSGSDACLQSDATSSFDPEIALAAMGEGERHSPSLPVIESVAGNVASAFTPEMALVAMGEGNEATAKASHDQYPAPMQQLETGVASTFDPTMDLRGMTDHDSAQVHGSFPSLTRPGDVTDGTAGSFDADMALAVENKPSASQFSPSMLSREQSAVDSHRVDSVASFDPEMALAAMGEGERTPSGSGSSNAFDPRMALVGGGSGSVSGVDTVTAGGRSLVGSGSFQLSGLGDAGMDVSLDGSGPELDFDVVLNEEFNRNARHS